MISTTSNKHSESSNLRRGFSRFYSWLPIAIAIANKFFFKYSLIRVVKSPKSNQLFLGPRVLHPTKNFTKIRSQLFEL